LLSAHDLAFVVKEGALVPRYLTARDEPWIRLLMNDMDAFVGRSVAELLATLPEREATLAVQHGIAPRIVSGARQVLEGLWRARVRSPVRPVDARRAAFHARAVRGAGATERDEALVAAAQMLGVDCATLELALFADMPEARVLDAPVEPPSPRAVAELYNLRLVQQILGRAQHARVEVRQHVRSVVRYAKLLRLICTYELGADSTAIALSGPLSVLRHTTKYGRAFASFLPCVLATPGWALEAHVSNEFRQLRFVAAAGDPVGSTFRLPREDDSAVERALVRDVRRLGTEWTIERETAAISLPGGRVFFPDFTMRRGSDRVLVELVGYYTPEYLQAKLEALAAVRSMPVVVAIDESLACADGDIPAARVVRYRRRVDAARLVAAVELALGAQRRW
jgi:hypothetical protein